MATPSKRFWSKVNKHGPRAGRLGRCWVWTASLSGAGYGQFWIAGRIEMAQRVAWGDVPEGLCVLHHCDNPPCVRRSHLFLGTKADNSRDMVIKGRMRGGPIGWTDCHRGHPYDADNTYIEPKTGSRHCKTCRREQTESSMTIRCIPVVSSNIEAIGYDRPTSTLRVIFQGARGYDYVNVPPEVVLDLLFAESHGSFFAKRIKGIYVYQKTEED